MDFNISEDLKMVQSLVKDFVNDQLKPLERDLLGRAADLSDATCALSLELDDKLANMAMEIGLWGINVPEEMGGAGLGVLGNCLVEEELSQTVIPFRLGDMSPVLFEASPDQKERYVAPLLDRRKQAYLAFLESENSAGLESMQVTAARDGQEYLIRGSKLSFSRVDPEGDYFVVVLARTGEKGVSCFLVDKGTRAMEVKDDRRRNGWQSTIMAPVKIEFDDCRVPVESLLGEEGKAFDLGKHWLPSRRVVRAARSVGVAQRLMEECSAQAQSWQAFGQVLSKRTNVEAALADIAIGIHACRLMVHEAAWKADEERPIKREAAMVKVFASDMIRRVADCTTHIFNGPPFVSGLPMERLCGHAVSTSATELALQLQRSIVARDILKGLKV